MKPDISRPSQEEIENLRLTSWKYWDCLPTSFEWEYDEQETAFLLEGSAEIILENGETFMISEGDLVYFPQGLKCKWKVLTSLKKRFVNN